MQVSIDVSAALAISRAWQTHPQLVMHELETSMGTVLEMLQGQVAERTPKNRSTLADKLYTRKSIVGDAVLGEVGSPLPYAMPVEMGTRPHYPPLAPLINWVEAKLGLVGDEAEGAARGIQRKIGRFGTPGYGMARYALLDSTPSIVMEFNEAAERIVAKLAALGGSGAPA